MNEQPSTVGIIVSVATETFEETAQLAAAAGMTIDTGSAALGILTGHAERSAVAGIGKLHGVLAVEQDRTFTLIDPGADVQ